MAIRIGHCPSLFHHLSLCYNLLCTFKSCVVPWGRYGKETRYLGHSRLYFQRGSSSAFGSSVGALEHLKLAVDESGMLVLAADGLLGTVDKLASDEGVANVLDSHKLDLGVLSSNLLQVLVQVLSVLV